MENTDKTKAQDIFENIELPEIDLLARRKNLREALMADWQAEKAKIDVSKSLKSGRALTRLQPKILLLAASIAIFILSYGYYASFVTTPTVAANMVLQVNPAVSLSVSDKNTIIDASGLDEEGELLIADLRLQGKTINDALMLIADKLYVSGFFIADRRILVSLSPPKGFEGDVDLTPLSDKIHNAFDAYLYEKNLFVDVQVAAFGRDLADRIYEAGFLPANYIDLISAAGSALTLQVLDLKNEFGIDPSLFKDEFGTITSCVSDMLDSGMTHENVMTALRFMINTDPGLRMLETMTDALIDLTEGGLSFEKAIAAIQTAIEADPSFEKFDELIDMSLEETDVIEDDIEYDDDIEDDIEIEDADPDEYDETDDALKQESKQDQPDDAKPEQPGDAATDKPDDIEPEQPDDAVTDKPDDVEPDKTDDTELDQPDDSDP